MFLTLPYCLHSSAKSIHSCFLHTTQGDAEHVELQESVYKNDTQGCDFISGQKTRITPFGYSPSQIFCSISYRNRGMGGVLNMRKQDILSFPFVPPGLFNTAREG